METAPALSLMLGFAQRTGLSAAGQQRRYLWTDAFAVCNFLGLGRRDLALRLVDRVHRTLGRHRPDDARTGWISGLSEQEGAEHPTRGGLRIGKPLPERRAEEPFDEQLEWNRDGQYFHYLTKWMHALDQSCCATGQRRLNLWARELLQAAFEAFARGGRMEWKRSIDLSRALVPSMGQHDPLDGYLTCAQLRATASAQGASDGPPLEAPLAAFGAMLRGHQLSTPDPLGIGGLLADALRAARLAEQGALPDEALPEALLRAALDGLRSFTRLRELQLPAWRRLAFRELGLAIGLRALERLRGEALPERPRKLVEALLAEAAPCAQLDSFWLAHRDGPGWAEHQDINDVMLATSLAPDGYLGAGRATASVAET